MMEKKVFGIRVIKDISSDPRVIRFIASTDDMDRDGDIIDVAGWNLSEWIKNPVIMWAHDYSQPPIAKGVNVQKDIRNKQLIIDARFPTIKELAPEGDPSEHAKFVETIYQLYKTDCLHAVSVGCTYDEIDKSENPMYANCRYHVTKQTLMELSCCPVGANQNALRAASAKAGIEKSAIDTVVKSMTIQEKGAIPFKHYPLADEGTKWDGPKVVADSEVEDLKVICAYFDGDGEVKGDYKLPHHLTKADGYNTVKAGVVAAVGALMGARGGVRIPEADVEKVKAHLRKHYDEFELDWPEEKSAWIEQAKSIGLDIEQKYGARLSADTMAKIDDLEKCVRELEEAVAACKACRDNMEKRIKALRDGVEPDETEPEPEEHEDNEKAVMATVIKVVE